MILVIRTDFDHPDAWAEIRKTFDQLRHHSMAWRADLLGMSWERAENETADEVPVYFDHPEYDGFAPKMAVIKGTSRHKADCAFIADTHAITDPEHTLLACNALRPDLAPFRCTIERAVFVVANLKDPASDWDKFLDALKEGVYRGTSTPP
ncbi:MAG: hypothetical protein AAGI68_08535 [Planctomycetota bacterium]